MAVGTGVQQEKNWQRIGVFVFAVAAFLLVSMGGAIVAAPVTVPFMYVVSRRHPTRAFRIAAASIGGLTAAEAAWALTYLLTTEEQPWIWAVPLASGAWRRCFVLLAGRSVLVGPGRRSAIMNGAVLLPRPMRPERWRLVSGVEASTGESGFIRLR